MTAAQQKMIAALQRGPIAWPTEDPMLGPAKRRTLKSLVKKGLVKRRCWVEPRPRAEMDEDWEEYSLA